MMAVAGDVASSGNPATVSLRRANAGMAVELDNVLSVAVESISVRGSGSAVDGRFAFWPANKVSADEITAGDPVTPKLIAAGA